MSALFISNGHYEIKQLFARCTDDRFWRGLCPHHVYHYVVSGVLPFGCSKCMFCVGGVYTRISGTISFFVIIFLGTFKTVECIVSVSSGIPHLCLTQALMQITMPVIT